MPLCPREELTHVHKNALCFGQRYDLQHATIRSALERFIPSCPVIDFDRPYFVIVVHDTVSKLAVSLVSTVAEAVGVKGTCSVSLLPEEGRVVQPYMRLHQDHRCIREEQNTLQVDALGR